MPNMMRGLIGRRRTAPVSTCTATAPSAATRNISSPTLPSATSSTSLCRRRRREQTEFPVVRRSTRRTDRRCVDATHSTSSTNTTPPGPAPVVRWRRQQQRTDLVHLVEVPQDRSRADEDRRTPASANWHRRRSTRRRRRAAGVDEVDALPMELDDHQPSRLGAEGERRPVGADGGGGERLACCERAVVEPRSRFGVERRVPEIGGADDDVTHRRGGDDGERAGRRPQLLSGLQIPDRQLVLAGGGQTTVGQERHVDHRIDPHEAQPGVLLVGVDPLERSEGVDRLLSRRRASSARSSAVSGFVDARLADSATSRRVCASYAVASARLDWRRAITPAIAATTSRTAVTESAVRRRRRCRCCRVWSASKAIRLAATNSRSAFVNRSGDDSSIAIASANRAPRKRSPGSRALVSHAFDASEMWVTERRMLRSSSSHPLRRGHVTRSASWAISTVGSRVAASRSKTSRRPLPEPLDRF